MPREIWYAVNRSERDFSIGDLTKLPTLSPNHQIDIFKFHRKSEVLQSNILHRLIRTGWLNVIKIKDGKRTVINCMSDIDKELQ